MEYHWDKEKIENIKKLYMDLKINTKDLSNEDLKEIDEILYMIKEMENIFIDPFPQNNCSSFKNYSIFNNPPSFIDETKILPKDTFHNFQTIPHFIQQWITNSISIIEEFIKLPDSLDIPKMNLSNEELVTLSHDFFSWLPNKKYINLADKYLSKEEHTLHIRENKALDYFGDTFVFYYPQYQPFILIERENTIQDFCTLNHEMAHGIYMATETKTSRKNNSSYLFELEGCQVNFLSRLYLKEKNIVSSQTLEILELGDFISLLKETLSFYMQSLAVFYYQTNNKKVNVALLKKHLPQIVENEDFPYESLLDNPKMNAMYILSFLTSLDLENIYVQDKELAFNEFESIRYNKTNDLEKNLIDHGITFMHDGYQNLCKRVRKLNLTKE